ncbi:hypothetical protein THAOC_04706, partial [Thalassiosira oceanica]
RTMIGLPAYAAIPLALLATRSGAFQPSVGVPIHHRTAAVCSPATHHIDRGDSSLAAAASGEQDGEEEYDEEYELVEFTVTPEQIAKLRKEAVKRDSRKKLPKFFLPPEETAVSEDSPPSPDTMGEILRLLENDELVEVRGVSKDSKKRAFDACHHLAGMVEDALEKPVVVVEQKGFAVRLYSPFDEEGREGRIELRSSYEPGKWRRKAKPVRDIRGQIVRGEDGKSIKEVPE